MRKRKMRKMRRNERNDRKKFAIPWIDHALEFEILERGKIERECCDCPLTRRSRVVVVDA